MAFQLTGNTGSKPKYEQSSGFSTGGKTKYCFMQRIMLNALPSSYAELHVSGGSYFLRILIQADGSLVLSLRTNAQNTQYTLGVIEPGKAVNYGVWCDLDVGQMIHIFDGAQVGATVDMTRQSFLSTTALLSLSGVAEDGVNLLCFDTAEFVTTIPTLAEVLTFGKADPMQFSAAPFTRYAPVGDGVTYQEIVPDNVEHADPVANPNGRRPLTRVNGPITGNVSFFDARTYNTVFINNVIYAPKDTQGFVVRSVSPIPDKSIIQYARGSHDGADNSLDLSDSTASFTVDEFVGFIARNKTDGSNSAIASNTATTVPTTLVGGGENDWDTGDLYSIELDVNYPDEIIFDLKTDLDGDVSLTPEGALTITGVAGTHTFNVKYRDSVNKTVTTEEVITATI